MGNVPFKDRISPLYLKVLPSIEGFNNGETKRTMPRDEIFFEDIKALADYSRWPKTKTTQTTRGLIPFFGYVGSHIKTQSQCRSLRKEESTENSSPNTPPKAYRQK